MSPEKDDGLRKNNRNHPGGIHLQWNIRILSTLDSAADNTPGVLNRDFTLGLRNQGNGDNNRY